MLFTLERSLQNNSTIVVRLMQLAHRTWTPWVCVPRHSREDTAYRKKVYYRGLGSNRKASLKITLRY